MTQPIRVLESQRTLDDSSTTAPGNGATVTGNAVDAFKRNTTLLFVRADQASAANGLEFQQSEDKSAWYTTTAQTHAANTAGQGTTYSFINVMRYVRWRFTASATGPTQGSGWLVELYTRAN